MQTPPGGSHPQTGTPALALATPPGSSTPSPEQREPGRVKVVLSSEPGAAAGSVHSGRTSPLCSPPEPTSLRVAAVAGARACARTHAPPLKASQASQPKCNDPAQGVPADQQPQAHKVPAADATAAPVTRETLPANHTADNRQDTPPALTFSTTQQSTMQRYSSSGGSLHGAQDDSQLRPSESQPAPAQPSPRDAPQSSTESQASQATHASSSVGSDDSAMFAKREVVQLVSHKSISALSSFSSQASALKKHGKRFHRHNHQQGAAPKQPTNVQAAVAANQAASAAEMGHQHTHAAPNGNADSNVLGTSCDCACPSPPQSPPLHTNDQMRIRTPASAVPSRRNSIEIGMRMPFTDRQMAPDDRIGPADALLKGSSVSHRLVRDYEPARAVMSTPNSPDRYRSETGSEQAADGTITPPHEPGSDAGRPTKNISHANLLPLHRGSSETITMRPQVDDLGRAPVKRTNERLKQLRDPKHPLYIPAVLRPTDERSYSACQRMAPAATVHSATILPPSRSHWKPDNSRDACRACSRQFTLLERRHHCRKCGDVFCANDSRFMIGIDQHLNFNLFGYPSRACRTCSDNFTHSVLEASRLSTDTTPLAPTGPQGIAIGQRMDGPQEVQVGGSLMPNVPADWNWSTF